MFFFCFFVIVWPIESIITQLCPSFLAMYIKFYLSTTNKLWNFWSIELLPWKASPKSIEIWCFYLFFTELFTKIKQEKHQKITQIIKNFQINPGYKIEDRNKALEMECGKNLNNSTEKVIQTLIHILQIIWAEILSSKIYWFSILRIEKSFHPGLNTY